MSGKNMHDLKSTKNHKKVNLVKRHSHNYCPLLFSLHAFVIFKPFEYYFYLENIGYIKKKISTYLLLNINFLNVTGHILDSYNYLQNEKITLSKKSLYRYILIN